MSDEPMIAASRNGVNHDDRLTGYRHRQQTGEMVGIRLASHRQQTGKTACMGPTATTLHWRGLLGVEAVRDLGRWQELRLERGTDAQVLLAAPMQRGRVRHFELGKPSLHDIFVRIARPEHEEVGHA